jgi:hypothetical protein
MKRITLLLGILLLGTTITLAQNPYKSLGVDIEPLTLSKGKFVEFFPNDSLVQIGSIILDTRTNSIVSFVVVDTAYSEATLEPELTVRFLQPDPLAAMYPDLSPYAYVANNPLIYIDPTGMWIAEYDEEGNIVNVRAEEGDNLAGLYDQLGITSEQFAEHFGISDLDGFEVIAGETMFDITSFALNSTDFDGSFTGSNCHGFVCTATGNSDSEGQVAGNNLLDNLGNPTETTDPKTGDVAVFETEGTINGVDLTGDPAHSAIFLLNNQAGEPQYLNRLNTGRPVTVNTKSQINAFFGGMAKKYNLPVRVVSNPKYYKKNN